MHQDADKLLRHVDDQLLDGFLDLAVLRPRDDFWLANHEFIALTAHHFNQDSKLQLTPAEHLEGVRVLHVLDSDGNIGQQLLLQALPQVT